MSQSATPVEGHEERRRAARAALRLTATVREAGRTRQSARVIDMSTHGCRIECPSPPPAGGWLLLSIAGLETIYCRVVWSADNFTGLEFSTPIAEAVLDRILQDQKQLSEALVSELRDIANRTHRAASRQNDSSTEILTELSRQCAVDAVVEGLRLSEHRQARPKDGKSAA